MKKPTTQPGDGPGGPSPKRKPLTIDLPAEAVERKEPEPASGEAAVAASAVGHALDADAPPGPDNSKASPPPIGEGGTLLRLLTAALAGAAAAVVVVLVLAAVGYPPPTDDENAAAASARLTALQGDVEGLGRRLDAQVPVDERLAAVEEKVGALAEQQPASPDNAALDALQQRVDALEAVGVAGNERAPPDLSPQLSALQQEVAALRAAAPAPVDLEAQLAPLRKEAETLAARVNALPGEERIQAIDGRIAALEAKLDGVERRIATAISLAPAVAADALSQRLETGAPFVDALAALRDLGVDPEALTALEPEAQSGIPTLADLQVRFEAAIAPIALSPDADEKAGALERLFSSARGLVDVRPAYPTAGDDPAAVVARIRAALAKGDLKAALAEREALPQGAKDATADWALAAEARLEADELLVRVRSDALARLGKAQ